MRETTRHVPKTLPAFFWYIVKPYKYALLFLMALGCLWALETSLTPYVMKEIIDRIATYHGDFEGAFHLLAPFVFCYVGLTVMNACSFRLREWIILKTIPAIQKDIWTTFFDYLMDHSHRFFQKNYSGTLANKIADMTRGVDDFLKNIAELFITQVLALLIACVAMYTVNPWFAIALFSWAVIFLSFSILSAKKAHYLAHIYSEDFSLLVGKTLDSINNVINIRMFSRKTHETRNIQQQLSANVKKDQTLQKYLLKVRAFQDLTLIILIAIMLNLLIYYYTQGTVTIGDFAFILTLSVSIFNGIWYLAAELVKMPEIIGRCSQALSILSTLHEVSDKENAKPLVVKKGKIEFQNVTFHYVRNNNIFKNVSLTIEADKKVGLVGFSGSGKTTFSNLILRYFDVHGGRILIDGQDISQVTQKSLRQAISLIPQDICLFHRSIMENIRYAKLDATDEEVIEAAKKAGAHDFIMHLEHGYNTTAEERGSKLSGGQRQRIAIARAILKNAPILILDEATSALDSVTEREIQKSLDRLMKGKTTLVIAHRLSTLANMDRILVFKDGTIVEDGTHKELLKKKGYYAHFWEVQSNPN